MPQLFEFVAFDSIEEFAVQARDGAGHGVIVDHNAETRWGGSEGNRGNRVFGDRPEQPFHKFRHRPDIRSDH